MSLKSDKHHYYPGNSEIIEKSKKKQNVCVPIPYIYSRNEEIGPSITLIGNMQLDND